MQNGEQETDSLERNTERTNFAGDNRSSRYNDRSNNIDNTYDKNEKKQKRKAERQAHDLTLSAFSTL